MRMAAFLFFAFVFGSQFIGGLNTKLPPPSYGNAITILSIDGGAIKGIIPSVILQHLETALKALDEEATLAGYFDVISGVSTGGIIAGLLTTPDPIDPTRPAFTASETLNFYLDYGPSIFNETQAIGYNPLLSLRPKYDGEFLHDKAREIFGDTRLHQTLTNIVIPTFDVKKHHQVIFSNLKLNKVPSLDAKLADILIGTSAAPTYLPPYYFKDGDNEFNLIDGFVATQTPALVAVSEVLQAEKEENSEFIPMYTEGPAKIILLSLGCGKSGSPPSYNATALKNYNGILWATVVFPAIAIAAGDSTNYHVASVAMESSDNYYLRIEEYNLDKSLDVMDNATQENMANLIKAGEELLEQPVKTLNITSFLPEEKPSEGTNAEAIQKLAEMLYNEKQFRLKNKKSMEKTGRPFIQQPLST